MSGSSCPLFVVGFDRSGTTLLSLILDSHSRIAIPYESHFIVPYYKNRDELGNLSVEENRLALVRRILAEPYVSRWDHRVAIEDIDLYACTSLEATVEQVYKAYARNCGKDIWGDKTPAYIADLHILNRMFPTSRFIHLIRDGRDVALSLVRQRWGPNNFMSALRYWAERVSCAQKMLAMLPDNRRLEIRFEDFVSNPSTHLRSITGFLGVEFEPTMLSDYQQRAERKVGEQIRGYHSNLSRPVSTSQTFKWRGTLSRADQAVAHEIAGPLLNELGYPPGATRHALKLFRKAYHRLRESYMWRFSRTRGRPA